MDTISKKGILFNFTRISNTQTLKREMYVKSLKTVLFSRKQMCKFHLTPGKQSFQIQGKWYVLLFLREQVTKAFLRAILLA